MIAHVRPSAQVTGCAHVAHAPPLASVCRPKGYNAMGVQPRVLVPTCEVLSRIMLWVFRGTYILRHFVQWHCTGRLPSSGKGAWRGVFTLVYHVSARQPSVRLSRSSTSNGNRDASFSGT